MYKYLQNKNTTMQLKHDKTKLKRFALKQMYCIAIFIIIYIAVVLVNNNTHALQI